MDHCASLSGFLLYPEQQVSIPVPFHPTLHIHAHTPHTHTLSLSSSFSPPRPPVAELWPCPKSWVLPGRAAQQHRLWPLAEEFQEAVLTVGLVVLLLEGSFVELLEAEGTDKVFRVKFLGHRGNATPRDGLLAAGTQRATALVVMHLAVRLPVVFKEAAVDEGSEAFLSGRRSKSIVRT